MRVACSDSLPPTGASLEKTLVGGFHGGFCSHFSGTVCVIDQSGGPDTAPLVGYPVSHTANNITIRGSCGPASVFVCVYCWRTPCRLSQFSVELSR